VKREIGERDYEKRERDEKYSRFDRLLVQERKKSNIEEKSVFNF